MDVDDIKDIETKKQNMRQIKRRMIFRRLFLVFLLLIFIFLIGNTLYKYYYNPNEIKEEMKEIVNTKDVKDLKDKILDFGNSGIETDYIKKMNGLLKNF